MKKLSFMGWTICIISCIVTLYSSGVYADIPVKKEKAIENFIKTGSCPGGDLSNVCLTLLWTKEGSKRPTKIDLTGANLSGAMLTGTDMSTGMSEVNFDGADLTNATLVAVNLRGASFRNSTLTNAKFILSHLENATISPVPSTNVKFLSTVLIGATLSGSMKKSIFTGAGLEKVTFDGVDLSGSDFTTAYLKDATFEKSETGNRVNFDNANFYKATLTGSTFSEGLSAKECFEKSVFNKSYWIDGKEYDDIKDIKGMTSKNEDSKPL